MADISDLSAPDSNGIVWKKLKSSSGKDFEVGYKHEDLQNKNALLEKQKKEGHYDASHANIDSAHENIAAINAAASSNSSNYGLVPVDWKVGDDKWIETDQASKNEGITRYKLYFNGHPNISSYTLEFTNTGGWSYHFIDSNEEKPEMYSIATIINGNHYLKYTSDYPTIRFFKKG